MPRPPTVDVLAAEPDGTQLLASAVVRRNVGSGSNAVVLLASFPSIEDEDEEGGGGAAGGSSGGGASGRRGRGPSMGSGGGGGGGSGSGSGSGRVERGLRVPRHRKTAVKVSSHFWDENAKKLLDCERETLMALPPHDNVVRVFAAFKARIPLHLCQYLTKDMAVAASDTAAGYTTQCFVMEFHPITLDAFRTALPVPFPYHLLWRIAYELVDAVDHMSRNRVAHLDLKLDNLMIGYDGRCVLTDFGIARLFPDTSFTVKYKEPFDLLMNRLVLAPEVLRDYDRARAHWTATRGAARSSGSGSTSTVMPAPAGTVAGDDALTIGFLNQSIWAVGMVLYELAAGFAHEPTYPEDGGGIHKYYYSLATLPPLPTRPAVPTAVASGMPPVALPPAALSAIAAATASDRSGVSRSNSAASYSEAAAAPPALGLQRMADGSLRCVSNARSAVSTTAYPATFVALVMAMLEADATQRITPAEALVMLRQIMPRYKPSIACKDAFPLLFGPPSGAAVGGGGGGAGGSGARGPLSPAIRTMLYVELPDRVRVPYPLRTGAIMMEGHAFRVRPVATDELLNSGVMAVLLRHTTGACRLLLVDATLTVDAVVRAWAVAPFAYLVEARDTGIMRSTSRADSSSVTASPRTPAGEFGPALARRPSADASWSAVGFTELPPLEPSPDAGAVATASAVGGVSITVGSDSGGGGGGGGSDGVGGGSGPPSRTKGSPAGGAAAAGSSGEDAHDDVGGSGGGGGVSGGPMLLRSPSLHRGTTENGAHYTRKHKGQVAEPVHGGMETPVDVVAEWEDDSINDDADLAKSIATTRVYVGGCEINKAAALQSLLTYFPRDDAYGAPLYVNDAGGAAGLSVRALVLDLVPPLDTVVGSTARTFLSHLSEVARLDASHVSAVVKASTALLPPLPPSLGVTAGSPAGPMPASAPSSPTRPSAASGSVVGASSAGFFLTQAGGGTTTPAPGSPPMTAAAGATESAAPPPPPPPPFAPPTATLARSSSITDYSHLDYAEASRLRAMLHHLHPFSFPTTLPPRLPSWVAADYDVDVAEALAARALIGLTGICNAALKGAFVLPPCARRLAAPRALPTTTTMCPPPTHPADPTGIHFPFVESARAGMAFAARRRLRHDSAVAVAGLMRNLSCTDNLHIARDLLATGALTVLCNLYHAPWDDNAAGVLPGDGASSSSSSGGGSSVGGGGGAANGAAASTGSGGGRGAVGAAGVVGLAADAKPPAPKHHGSDIRFAEDAILAISNLVRFDDLQTLDLPHSAIAGAVAAALSEHKTAHTLLDSAVRLLRYQVAASPPEVADLLARGGVLGPLVAVCHAHLHDRALLENLLHFLSTVLVYESTRRAPVCPYRECAEVMVEIMHASEYEDDVAVLGMCATVLRNLACVTAEAPGLEDDDAPFELSPAQVVAAAGAAAALEGAMERHQHAAAVQENGRCALYNLLLLGQNDARAMMERAVHVQSKLRARAATVAATAAVAAPSPASLAGSSSGDRPTHAPAPAAPNDFSSSSAGLHDVTLSASAGGSVNTAPAAASGSGSGFGGGGVGGGPAHDTTSAAPAPTQPCLPAPTPRLAAPPAGAIQRSGVGSSRSVAGSSGGGGGGGHAHGRGGMLAEHVDVPVVPEWSPGGRPATATGTPLAHTSPLLGGGGSVSGGSVGGGSTAGAAGSGGGGGGSAARCAPLAQQLSPAFWVVFVLFLGALAGLIAGFAR